MKHKETQSFRKVYKVLEHYENLSPDLFLVFFKRKHLLRNNDICTKIIKELFQSSFNPLLLQYTINILITFQYLKVQPLICSYREKKTKDVYMYARFLVQGVIVGCDKGLS